MFAALNTIEPHFMNLAAIDFFHADEAWAKERRPEAVKLVQTRLASLSERLHGRRLSGGPLHRGRPADDHGAAHPAKYGFCPRIRRRSRPIASAARRGRHSPARWPPTWRPSPCTRRRRRSPGDIVAARLRAYTARMSEQPTAGAPLPSADPDAECPRCGKPPGLCVCEVFARINNKVSLLILQHPQEQDRYLGTARLHGAAFRGRAAQDRPCRGRALTRIPRPRSRSASAGRSSISVRSRAAAVPCLIATSWW